MKSEFIEKVTHGALVTWNRSKLVLKKHSPEILMVAGTAAVIGGVVLAIKETLNLEPILDAHASMRNAIDTCEEKGTAVSSESGDMIQYTTEMAKHDRITNYLQTAWKCTKLYAPSATLVLGGIGCFLAAYGIMRKRNLALIAAYKALESEFAEYRRRVIEDRGEEADLKYRTGIVQSQVTDENGEVHENEFVFPDGEHLSGYARIFDHTNPYWNHDKDYNMAFLTSQEASANRRLYRHGHMMLNEMYDMLGFEHTREGAVVGWLEKDMNPKCPNDGNVDLKILRCWRHTNGIEDEISTSPQPNWEEIYIIDFNVDGVIYDLLSSNDHRQLRSVK